MLHRDATLQQVSQHLLRETRILYPGNESASISRLILEHLGFTTARCITEPARKAGQVKVSQVNEIVEELHTRKPIQYILGYTWFYDLKIRLSSKTLIPRPETEELVALIARSDRHPVHVMDLGTGSGCIALALKKSFPLSRVRGLDMDTGALEMASLNGRLLGLEADWIRHDLLTGEPLSFPGPFDLVVSNPPYVTMNERSAMEVHVLDYEPSIALFVADEDPLLFYRAILKFCRNHLAAGGRLWVEINERFGKETAGIFTAAGMQDVIIHTDLHGKERFISATG